MKLNNTIVRYSLLTLAIQASQFAYCPLVFAAKFNSTMEEQTIGEKDSIFSDSPLEWDWNKEYLLVENRRKEQYALAFDYIKKNQLEKASKIITNFLEQYPEDIEFINLNALLKVVQKDVPAAKQNYQKVLKLKPNNSSAILGLAKLSLQDGNEKYAKKQADKVLSVNEKSLGAYFLLAEVAEQQGKKQKVEKILLKGLKKVTGDVNTEAKMASALGRFYAKQKQAEKLLPIAQNMVNRYPNDIIALSTLAGAQMANKQSQLAEQTLKQIVKQEQYDIDHRLLLVNLLLNTPNREKDVFKLLDEVLQIQANNPQALFLKATYEIKQKQYQSALETINLVDGLYPKQAIAMQLKGDLFLAEKKYGKALEFYQHAYQIKPTTKTMLLLVDLLKIQKKEAAAFELLNNELKKNNKNSAVHYKLASIYQQLKDYKQAETHYKAILAEHNDNALVLNNLAWVYYKQNKPEALGLAKRAYEIAPESPSIADTYGTMLIKQGDQKQGLAIIEKAALAKPESNDIQYHLALAYSANGNNKQAIEILQRLEQAEQYFSEKKSAIELLKNLKGF